MKTAFIATFVHTAATNGSSKKELERRLAEIGLGIVGELRAGKMSIAQAEHDLFNLDTYVAARKQRLNRDLIELLQWGMELEDVAELAPRGIQESFQKITLLARKVIQQSLPATIREKRMQGASERHKSSDGAAKRRRKTALPG